MCSETVSCKWTHFFLSQSRENVFTYNLPFQYALPHNIKIILLYINLSNMSRVIEIIISWVFSFSLQFQWSCLTWSWFHLLIVAFSFSVTGSCGSWTANNSFVCSSTADAWAVDWAVAAWVDVLVNNPGTKFEKESISITNSRTRCSDSKIRWSNNVAQCYHSSIIFLAGTLELRNWRRLVDD